MTQIKKLNKHKKTDNNWKVFAESSKVRFQGFPYSKPAVTLEVKFENDITKAIYSIFTHFKAMFPFFTPSKNFRLRFSDIFRVSKKGTWTWNEVRNSRVTKPSYAKRRHTSQNKKLHFELLTRRFNFYFSTFKLLTRSWKIKNCISSY